MPPVAAPAIILQSFQYSETSKILRLLTRTHGVQSVIAKGALRPRSQFGGILEPFTEGIAAFSLRENRDLHTLTAFDLTRSRQILGTDLMRFGGASLIAELTLRVVAEESDAALYDQVRDALDRLEQVPVERLETTVLAEAWSLIAALGYAPALEDCINCGRPIRPDEETVFDYTAGGVRCLQCGVGEAGRNVPAAARATLLHLVSGESVPIGRTPAHWRLLDRYLSHHVLEGAPLNSLHFLVDTAREGS